MKRVLLVISATTLSICILLLLLWAAFSYESQLIPAYLYIGEISASGDRTISFEALVYDSDDSTHVDFQASMGEESIQAEYARIGFEEFVRVLDRTTRPGDMLSADLAHNPQQWINLQELGNGSRAQFVHRLPNVFSAELRQELLELDIRTDCQTPTSPCESFSNTDMESILSRYIPWQTNNWPNYKDVNLYSQATVPNQDNYLFLEVTGLYDWISSFQLQITQITLDESPLGQISLPLTEQPVDIDIYENLFLGRQTAPWQFELYIEPRCYRGACTDETLSMLEYLEVLANDNQIGLQVYPTDSGGYEGGMRPLLNAFMCTAEQGVVWEYIYEMYGSEYKYFTGGEGYSQDIIPDNLENWLISEHINIPRFEACYGDWRYDEKVKQIWEVTGETGTGPYVYLRYLGAEETCGIEYPTGLDVESVLREETCP